MSRAAIAHARANPHLIRSQFVLASHALHRQIDAMAKNAKAEIHAQVQDYYASDSCAEYHALIPKCPICGGKMTHRYDLTGDCVECYTRVAI
jgi:hypothetical protein